MNDLATSGYQNSDHETNESTTSRSILNPQTQDENLREILSLQEKTITIANNDQHPREINASDFDSSELNPSLRQQSNQHGNDHRLDMDPSENEPQQNSLTQYQNIISGNLQTSNSAIIDSPEFAVFYEPETKIYLAKVCIMFAALIACPMQGLLTIYGIVDHAFFIYIAIFSLLCLGIIDLLWTQKELGDLWTESDDVFKPYEMFSISIALLVLGLKIECILPTSFYAFIPPILYLDLYLDSSKASLKAKAQATFIKACYIAQIMLISCKIDNYLNWDWKLIFCFALAYLGVSAISSISFMLSLYRKLTQNSNSSHLQKKLGFCWYLGYCSLPLLAMPGLYGFTRAYDSTKDFKLLEVVAYISIPFNAFMLIVTILTRKSLIKFIIFFRLIKSHRAIFVASVLLKPKKMISFHVEKKEYFFKMISPTYFVSLEKNCFANNGENANKIKSMINSFKLAKFKLIYSSLRKKYQESSSLIINTLSTIKSNIIKNFKEISEVESQKKDCLTKKVVEDVEKIDFNSTYLRNTEDEKDENLCYICFQKTADAIITPCGHGGVCYDCVALIVKQKDECMECRKRVEALYRVIPGAKRFGIVKGTEVSKLVVNYS